MTRHLRTPGGSHPGSWRSTSFGPKRWRLSKRLLLSDTWTFSRMPALGGSTDGAGCGDIINFPAASGWCSSKRGSQTAAPVLGSSFERKGTPKAFTTASISEICTDTDSPFLNVPSNRRVSCRLPEAEVQLSINPRTSASDMTGKSSCERSSSTKSIESAAHLLSCVTAQKFLRRVKAAMSCSLSFSWKEVLSSDREYKLKKRSALKCSCTNFRHKSSTSSMQYLSDNAKRPGALDVLISICPVYRKRRSSKNSSYESFTTSSPERPSLNMLDGASIL
mmetsp:Transcript_45318/g.107833  ORF Transcript_45318/g.107833 Transcript_45318/m.107833 type:complete len:278 (+) Transcript_45318:721-1554(+)